MKINEIAIFANNDEEGKRIIEWFVNNGCENRWGQKGNYRHWYYVGSSSISKFPVIYSTDDKNYAKKYNIIELDELIRKNYLHNDNHQLAKCKLCGCVGLFVKVNSETGAIRNSKNDTICQGYLNSYEMI